MQAQRIVVCFVGCIDVRLNPTVKMHACLCSRHASRTVVVHVQICMYTSTVCLSLSLTLSVCLAAAATMAMAMDVGTLAGLVGCAALCVQSFREGVLGIYS